VTLPSSVHVSASAGRVAIAIAAATLALVALFLPTEWYDSIPRLPGLRIPFSGVTLLRLTFAAEALILASVATRNVRFRSIDGEPDRGMPSRLEMPFDIGAGPALGALAFITGIGLFLRLYGLEQDLWLDEITPIVDYARLSAAQVMGSYLRSNNHLMNTILLKASIGSFGESEWSARMPAVVFGTLTIPVLYWTARTALSRAGSLAAALMLAMSYHHVFFSQNARGYTAYLFFALVSTGLLIAALRDDQLWRWALYVAAAVLGSASLLITVFVLAGHALLLATIGILIRRRNAPVAPFARRSIAVLAVSGLFVFQLYAAAMPEAYVVIKSVYAEPSAGFAPFSAEFFSEMLRGIGAGFGNPVFVALFLIVGAMGFAALCYFCWPLATALALPIALTAVSLGIRGLAFSPRFFLLLLPLAMLAAASGLQGVGLLASGRGMLSPRRVRYLIGAGAVMLAAAGGRSLEYYYRTPKQPYRAALRFVDTRFGNGKIIVVSSAAGGFQYYVRRLPVAHPMRYVYTRSVAQFDSLDSSTAGESPQVLTTFSRALRLELPGISERLGREWQADTVFAATVGDGEITVWSRKQVAPARVRE